MDATAEVVTLNVVVVDPAGTVTDPGTTVLNEFEFKEMFTPLGPAGPERVIVPVAVFPPMTELGAIAMPVSEAAVTVRVAVSGVLPCVPVIVTGPVVETAIVEIVKVALVAPEGIVTVAGTEAFPLDAESVMAIPAVGAGPFKVTVPVDDVPPITDVGERVKPVSVGAVIVKVDETDVLP